MDNVVTTPTLTYNAMVLVINAVTNISLQIYAETVWHLAVSDGYGFLEITDLPFLQI